MRPSAMAAAHPSRRTIGPAIGGSTFAERPDRPAPEARLLWRADLDRSVVAVRAEPVALDDPDAFDLARLARWATLVRNDDGREHLALSDGWRRVRLDVAEGTLLGPACARLHYLLSGFSRLNGWLATLEALDAFWRQQRFPRTLFPPPAGRPRCLEVLRVADALADGASHREIAIALFGEARVRTEWNGPSDYLLSRVRRRVADAKRMAKGGWRRLLTG